MCMDDVRIGRKEVPEVKAFPATAAVAPGLPEDSTRTALVVGNQGPNTVFLLFSQGDPLANGLPLPVGTLPLVLNVKDHGQLVTHGFSVVCNAAQTAQVVTWSTYLGEK